MMYSEWVVKFHGGIGANGMIDFQGIVGILGFLIFSLRW